MKGRLTLEKVNAAINDMATYAEANAQLVAAPRKKVSSFFLFSFFLAFCISTNFLVLHMVFPKLSENLLDRALVSKLYLSPLVLAFINIASDILFINLFLP